MSKYHVKHKQAVHIDTKDVVFVGAMLFLLILLGFVCVKVVEETRIERARAIETLEQLKEIQANGR
jgi:hypothetical protein